MNSRIKIVLVGDSRVGKSSVISRYKDNYFNETFIPTLGIDYRYKDVNIDGKTYQLEIWDTVEQEKFRDMTLNCIRGAHAIIYMFDCNNLTSFQNINFWTKTFNEENTDNFLVGNKSDLQNVVSTDEIYKNIINSYNMDYIEISALNGSNVSDMFEHIVRSVLNKNLGINFESLEIKEDQEPPKNYCFFF